MVRRLFALILLAALAACAGNPAAVVEDDTANRTAIATSGG
jgi:hypothetical protein